VRNRRLQAALAVLFCLAISPWCLAQPPAAAKAKPAPATKADAGGYDILYEIRLPLFADPLVAKIKEGMQKELANQKPGESEDDFSVRKQFLENVQAGLVRVIKEVDAVRLGWKLDRKNRRTHLDLGVTALNDTKLAGQFAQAGELKTAFGGFILRGAAVAARGVGQAPKDEAANSAKLVDMIRKSGLKKIVDDSISDDEKKIRKDLFDKLMDVVRDSVASGRSDGALSLVLQPNRVTLVAAGYTADGAKLESVIKPVAEYLVQRVPFITLKLDAEKYEGVNLHTLSMPAPQDDNHDKFVQAIGESLDVVLGFGKEAVYVAAGKDAMQSLKDAIHKSASPAVAVKPLEISVALKSIADFIAVVGKPEERGPAQMFANMLGQSKGKDHVRLVVEPIKRGMILRLNAEPGVLDLISALNPQIKEFLEVK
jgi:hypothetical protein